MDTSTEYIKMCDTPEIQYNLTDYGFKEKLPRIRKALFGGELKMFCTEGDWLVNVAMVGLSQHAIRTVRAVEGSPKLLWLPRQDQLQEMVNGGVEQGAYGFIDWQVWLVNVYGLNYGDKPNGHLHIFNTWEQLWLAFVMQTLHSKVWDGSAWVASCWHSVYREEHREQIAEKNRKWRLSNPDKVNAIHQRQKDKGYSSTYQKYYRTTAACKYSALKLRAGYRGIGFEIGKTEFLVWFADNSGQCSYCGESITVDIGENRKTWLTVDRKDNDKHYTLGNITIACMRCNLMKSNDISYKLMVKIGKLISEEKFNKTWNGTEWVSE